MADRLTSTPQRRLLLGAVTNWLAFAAVMATAFFLAPYLIHKLGDATYGIWGFVESILAYLTLLDLGMAACVTRYVAKLHADRASDELNRLVSACLGLFCLAGGVVLIIGCGLAWWLSPILAARSEIAGGVTPFMLLMVVNLAITLPMSVFPAMLDGMERYTIKSAVKLVFLALRVSGMILVTETWPGLLGLGVVLTITNLAEHVVYAFLARRVLPTLVLSRSLIDRATLSRVKGYSVDAFLAMLAGRISVQTATLVIGLAMSAASVTQFLVASRLIEMAKSLLRSATTTLTPAFSSLDAQNRHEEMRQIFLSATRIVLILMIPIMIGMILFGPAFLTRWLGSADYVTTSYPTLWILSLTLPFVIAQSVAARVLYGVGRLRRFARMALIESAVNFSLSLLLVRWYGITGIAVAIAVPNIIFCIAILIMTCQHLNMGMGQYLRQAWRTPLVMGTLLAIGWWALREAMPPVGWGDLVAVGALGVIPYLIAFALIEGRLKLRKFLPVRQSLPVRQGIR